MQTSRITSAVIEITKTRCNSEVWWSRSKSRCQNNRPCQSRTSAYCNTQNRHINDCEHRQMRHFDLNSTSSPPENTSRSQVLFLCIATKLLFWIVISAMAVSDLWLPGKVPENSLLLTKSELRRPSPAFRALDGNVPENLLLSKEY